MATCDHCGREVAIDAFGTPLHVDGPAEGSFICHIGPIDQVPSPGCDCWTCVEALV